MYKLKFITAKSAAIALTLASLSMTPSVQAHNDDYLPLLTPFIIYKVLTKNGQHSHHQHKQHKHYQKPSRHSHSRSGYSKKRLIKKHRRF